MRVPKCGRTSGQEEERKRERGGEKDLKGDATRPTPRASIVKFSYKFLLDVNSKTAAGGPNKASRKGSRDAKRESVESQSTKEGGWHSRLRTPSQSSLPSSLLQATCLYLVCLLVLLIPVRLTVCAAKKLVLLVAILSLFSLLLLLHVAFSPYL